LDSLTSLLGKTPGYKFILFGFAKDHKQNETIEDIQLIDVQLRINMVETDEVYKVAMESLTIFINALMVCVIIVTAMFVTSNMKRFIYKYNHDLAIIRAIGGRKEQVKSIFRYIILYIAFLGCAGGFIFSIFFSKLIMGWINSEIHLIDGGIQYDFISSLLIAATCFFVLVLILLLSIQKSFKILP
jgi:putative ABC transport system permease protein